KGRNISVHGISEVLYLGTKVRRAKDRRVGDLAAQPAADAVVVHVRDRVHFERIAGRLDGERGAAGEADAGMVPRAHVLVHAEARAHHALARFEGRADLRAATPLALDVALRV